MRKEKSKGDPIPMNKEQKVIRMIKIVRVIAIGLIGCLVCLIVCMILRVNAEAEGGISGREGCQWLVGKHGSIEDLRGGYRGGFGIKGVDRMGWTYPSMMSLVTAGICVCPSIHVYLTASLNLLTSRDSLRLGYTLYRAKSLPSTGRTVRAIKSIRLNKARGSYVYL